MPMGAGATMTNDERARRARTALDALHDGDGEDAAVDLIADCLHYCRRQAMDPEEIAQLAIGTWRTEDQDASGDGKRHLGPGVFARLRGRAVWYTLAVSVAVAVALLADEITELLAAVH